MLLFTRPLPKLNVSAAAFEQAEIDAVGVATTDIVYVRTESDAARQFLRDNTVDIVIVTSVYAVETAVSSVAKSTSQALPIFIAVGDATARKLRFGLANIKGATVLTPSTHTSEGILAMHQFDNEFDYKISFPLVNYKRQGRKIDKGIRTKDESDNLYVYVRVVGNPDDYKIDYDEKAILKSVAKQINPISSIKQMIQKDTLQEASSIIDIDEDVDSTEVMYLDDW